MRLLRAALLFCLILAIVVSCLLLNSASAQTEDERLDADLPERVQIPVLDVTTVLLVPRERFEDSWTPQIGEHYGRYAKERAWTLPPDMLLGRLSRPEALGIPDLQVRLTAAPRVPGSFLYDALLIRSFEQGYGLAHLGQDFLTGSQTTDERSYRASHARAAVDYHHREGAYLNADVLYQDRGIEWLLSPAPGDTESPGFRRRDASFLQGNLRWNEPVGRSSKLGVSVDASSYQLRMSQDENEQTTDVRLRTDLTTPWPYLYPLRLGAMVEFQSAEETVHVDQTWDATSFRVYLRDSLIHMGAFTVDARFELATLWEPGEEEQGERLYYPNPELSLTTQLAPTVAWQLEGGRTVERARPESLYVEHDYTVILPQLKAEKTWYGETSLRFAPVGVDGVVKVGVRRTDDLTIREPIAASELLAWRPAGMDVRIFYTALNLMWKPTSELEIALDYRHETHDPLRQGEVAPNNIPFRAIDQGEIRFMVAMPTGWRLGLGGQYVGERHADAMTDDRLEGYFLIRPSVRYRASESTEIYAKARFSVGEYRDLPAYELPQHVADLGVTLRF